MVTAVPTIAVFPDEKLTLEQRIEKWVWHYCRTLEENYKQSHIRSMERMSSDYSNQQLEDVKNGTANLMKFRMEFGRKYIKIIHQDFDTFQDRNEYRMEVFMLSLIKRLVRFTSQPVGSHLILSM